MNSPLAAKVHRRFALSAVLFLAAFIASLIWPAAVSKNTDLFFIGIGVFCAFGFIFSIGIANGFRFQKIHIRLRPGVVIKWTYWLTILLAIAAGIASYYFFFEKNERPWEILVAFLSLLANLFIIMSVRYAIEEDVKKGKVCEFC